MEPTRADVEQFVVALFTVNAGLERARRRGSANTLAVLQVTAAAGRVRPTDIAAGLGVHQSSITRQIRALENAGQVLVTPDPNDGRSCFVSLTEAGQDELGRLTEVGMDRFRAFVADWEAEEVRTLTRLLTKFERSKAAFAGPKPQPTGRRWRRAT